MNNEDLQHGFKFFLDFEFFENFLKIVQLRQISICLAEILCANALILSETKFYLQILDEFEFFYSLYHDIKF